MQSSLTEKKSELRAIYLQKRRDMDSREAEQKSLLLRKNILDAVLDAKIVLMFSPVRREPDILPLADELLRRGIRVAFPVSHMQELRLEFREIHDLSELSVGAYGIKEPSADAPTLSDFDGAVCLVPALAFDLRGMRIGYGKGYYDRFLRDFPVRSLGVAFSSFITHELPTEENDLPVDMIITEGGSILPQ